MALQLIFGMTYSNLDDYLLFGMRIIVMVLKNDDRARVRMPCLEKIDEYKHMVRNRHSFLTDVWCTMDGLKLTLEQSGNCVFVPMEPSLLLILMFQVLFMTVRLLTTEKYMMSLRVCINGIAQNAPLILLLVMLPVNI